jgi:hypothetical protein
MQLTSTPTRAERRSTASKVALASCALLAAAPGALAGQGDASASADRYQWTTRAAVLHYAEQGRIKVKQGSLAITGAKAKSTVQLNMGYDVVSGPSENGALPAAEPQTFTSPSGKEDYTVAAGELPTYTIDRHPRKEISLSKTDIVNSQYSVSYGARYSTEATYVFRSANAGLTRNANKNNTQYALSVAYEDADITPYGGAVQPRTPVLNRTDFATEAAFNNAWQAQRDTRTLDRDAYSAVLGVTQVINRNAVVQLSYTGSYSSGYQNDAQKLVSVIDPQGHVLANLHENRPQQRSKHSLFTRAKWHLDNAAVVDVNYRYFTDNWGVKSHTLGLGYQFHLSEKLKLEPQLRWYRQSRAEFFRHSVFADSQASALAPQYLSADYRLADTVNYTVGLNADYYLSNGHVLSARLAHYDINPKTDASSVRGAWQGAAIMPSIRSTIIAFSYEF